MKSYSEAQQSFNTMVQSIAAFMKNRRGEGKNIEFAKSGVNYVLASERVKFSYEKFAPIPYLEKLFEEYKKQLLEKPTEAPQIELDTLK